MKIPRSDYESAFHSLDAFPSVLRLEGQVVGSLIIISIGSGGNMWKHPGCAATLRRIWRRASHGKWRSRQRAFRSSTARALLSVCGVVNKTASKSLRVTSCDFIMHTKATKGTLARVSRTWAIKRLSSCLISSRVGEMSNSYLGAI